MNVNGITQIALGHAGTLNVPAGSSLTPGRFPIGLSFLLRLPKDEIQRILLELAGHLNIPVASFQIVNILMREFAVRRKCLGFVIDRSILDRIGIPLINQCGNHLNHVSDFPGRLRMNAGRPDIHRLHVLLALGDIALRDLGRIYSFLIGLSDNLVIHICEIGDIGHLIAPILHVAAERIKYNHGTGISNMNQIVDRGTTDIHLHFSWLDGNKFLFASGQSIKNLHWALLVNSTYIFADSSEMSILPQTIK